MSFNDFRLDVILALQVSGMVCIYVLGMIAATRILPRWSLSWWGAVIAVPLTSVLLIAAGPNLLYPLAGAIAAIIVTVVKRVRRTRVG